MKKKIYPDNIIVGDLRTYGCCEEIEYDDVPHPDESDLQYTMMCTDNIDEEELPFN